MIGSNYRFTENWFDVATPTWEQVFKLVPKPKSILEIGCFEGRATTWLCDNVICGDACDYDVIDTFEGTVGESGMAAAAEKLEDADFIQNNFFHNISFHNNVNFKVYKGLSQKVLPTFAYIEKYDFIYIDASHRADDTFVDAYYAHKLLKSGGLLIFDDFLWKDPKDVREVGAPEFGINAFCSMYADKYDPLFRGYQLGLVKK